MKPGRLDNADQFLKVDLDACEFLKVDLDACDEAKFKVPRNTCNAKNLERLWRPQLHLHGAVVWGATFLISCSMLIFEIIFLDCLIRAEGHEFLKT